jgi:YgiT-type zinc finger domain-containing protein
MTRRFASGLCALCGGKRRAGRVTHSIDLGSTLVVVRNVEAKVCDQCGESWLDDATVAHLERIVHEARARGVQVEVVSLP